MPIVYVYAVHHKSMRWVKVCAVYVGKYYTVHPNTRAEEMAKRSKRFGHRFEGHGISSHIDWDWEKRTG